MNNPIAALLAQTSGGPNVGNILSTIYHVLVALYYVWLAVCVVMLVAGYRVFKKAGQPGWAILVPFYNLAIFMRVCGLSSWWALAFLAALIPVLGWIPLAIWLCWVNHRLAQRFGKPIGFTVGLVLLHPIFLCILAFDSSEYQAVPGQA